MKLLKNNTTEKEQQFEDHLLQHFEFYKSAFELSKDPKLVLEDCIIIRFNPATMTLFECEDPHEIHMKRFSSFLPEDLNNGYVSKQCEGNVQIESTIRTCKDNLIPVTINFDTISRNGKQRTIATIHDITDTIKTKKELEDANEFVFSVMENLPVGVSVRKFSDKTLKYMNKHFPEIMGWPKDVVQDFDMFFKKAYSSQPGEAERIKDLVVNSLIQNQLSHWGTVKLEDSEGRERLLDMTMLILKDQDLMVTTARNVTNEHKAFIWKHVKSEVIKALPNPVVITNHDGRIMWLNPAFEKTYGYTLAEATGQTPRILKSGQHDQEFYKEMWDTIKAGKIWKGAIVNKTKDGTIVNDHQIIVPVRAAGAEITNFAAITNLTEEELDYFAK